MATGMPRVYTPCELIVVCMDHAAQVASCRDTCVPESVEPDMLFTTGVGIFSFDTEANIGTSLPPPRPPPPLSPARILLSSPALSLSLSCPFPRPHALSPALASLFGESVPCVCRGHGAA